MSPHHSPQIDMRLLQPSDVEPKQFDSDSSFTLQPDGLGARLFSALVYGGSIVLVVALYMFAVVMAANELFGGAQ